MSFVGFPKEGVAWFDALALTQTREWFQANKGAYEALWLTPMKALLEELPGPLAKIYGRKMGPAKLFRLNRDVRFAKDKRPYKTHIAALIPFEGFEPMAGPAALYFHLGAEETVAFGFYMLEAAGLKTLRAALLDEKQGPKLAALINVAVKQGFSPDAMERLKRTPPGVPMDHPRAELLKNKALALSCDVIPKSVRYSAKFKPWLLEQAAIAAPVVKWGLQHKLAG